MDLTRRRAPGAELAGLYPQRWELESALDELKPISADQKSCCAPVKTAVGTRSSCHFRVGDL
jgi:hypothetical protein